MTRFWRYSTRIPIGLPLGAYRRVVFTRSPVFRRSQTLRVLSCSSCSPHIRSCLQRRIPYFGMRDMGTFLSLHWNVLPPTIWWRACLDYHGCPDICTACLQGKQHRDSFPQEASFRASTALPLVPMDLSGPMTTVTPGGARYFFLLVDDFSRKVWVFFLA